MCSWLKFAQGLFGFAVAVIVVIVRVGLQRRRVRADGAVDQPCCSSVDHEAHGRDVEHAIGARSGPLREIRDRLDDDEGGGRQDEQGVEDRGDRFGSTQAVGETGGGVPAGDAYRQVGKSERRDVGHDVQRFGSEHVAVGPKGPEELSNEERAHDDQNDEHAAGLAIFVMASSVSRDPRAASSGPDPRAAGVEAGESEAGDRKPACSC